MTHRLNPLATKTVSIPVLRMKNSEVARRAGRYLDPHWDVVVEHKDSLLDARRPYLYLRL